MSRKQVQQSVKHQAAHSAHRCGSCSCGEHITYFGWIILQRYKCVLSADVFCYLVLLSTFIIHHSIKYSMYYLLWTDPPDVNYILSSYLNNVKHVKSLNMYFPCGVFRPKSGLSASWTWKQYMRDWNIKYFRTSTIWCFGCESFQC